MVEAMRLLKYFIGKNMIENPKKINISESDRIIEIKIYELCLLDFLDCL